MKRNIFKALAVVTALALSSCSMSNTVKKDDVDTDKKEAYITIDLNQTDRTALPTVSNANDFSRISLSKKPAADVEDTGVLCGYWETNEEGTAYEKMTAAKIGIEAGETYLFTLDAYKGGSYWLSTVTQTIETGENHLSFKLTLTTLSSSGKGSLDVMLTVPDVVKAVEAELKTIDESQTITPEDAALTFADGKAKYTASEIAAGNYVLVYTLYGDTEKITKLGEWREYAGITKEVTSSSKPVIKSEKDLANIYKITLEPNGGTIQGSFPGSYTCDYTRYSDPIPLPYNAIRYDNDGKLVTPNDNGFHDPIFSRKNYIFEGWFDKETGGNKVQEIPSGSTGDIKLYARWTDTFTVDVDSYDTVDAFGEYLSNSLRALQKKGFDSIKLKLTNMADAKDPMDWSTLVMGSEEAEKVLSDYMDERFATIFETIYAVQELNVKLDLSETSLEYLPFAAFADFNGFMSGEPKSLSNLIEITLPQNLSAILPYSFILPGFNEITIPKKVTYMCMPFTTTQTMTINFESGSLIEVIDMIGDELCPLNKITIPAKVKEIKDIAFAGSELNEISFESGSHLEKIGEKAFEACNFETITLSASLESIGDNAFHACDSLATIKFEGTKEQWAVVTRGTDWHKGVPATTVTCSDGVVGLDYPIGTKLLSEQKEVGDIVFNDGSATPYTEGLTLTDAQKAAAIAIIFYKGTGLNSDVFAGWDCEDNVIWNAGDTTTIRTLGVGLKHISDIKWLCLSEDDELTGSYAQGLDIETIICPATNNSGVYTFTCDRNGSDNLQQMIDYIDRYCDGDILSPYTPEYYPAFYSAINYADQKIGSETTSRVAGTAYEDGWYLPSIAELYQIYTNGKGTNKVFDIDTVSELCGGDKFGNSEYWSSSHYQEDTSSIEYLQIYAWSLQFNGNLWTSDKQYEYRVCAIREF